MIKLSLVTFLIFKLSLSEVTAQDSCGHMRFELIKYELVDSSEFDKESAKQEVELMKGEFEYDIYYTQNKLVEVRKRASGEITRKSIFDKSSLTHTHYLITGDGKYFSIDSIKSSPANSALTSEEDLLNNIPTIKGLPSENKNIFGFDCQKITVLSPIEKGKVLATLFTTTKIPTPNTDSGRFTFLSMGYPLETMMNMLGIELHIGIVEYEVFNDDHKVFFENNEEYELIELQELLLLAEQ